MLDIAGVAQIVEAVVASAHIPGLALAIVTTDGTAYMHGYTCLASASTLTWIIHGGHGDE